jgi:hypothetical protein
MSGGSGYGRCAFSHALAPPHDAWVATVPMEWDGSDWRPPLSSSSGGPPASLAHSVVRRALRTARNS